MRNGANHTAKSLISRHFSTHIISRFDAKRHHFSCYFMLLSAIKLEMLWCSADYQMPKNSLYFPTNTHANKNFSFYKAFCKISCFLFNFNVSTAISCYVTPQKINLNIAEKRYITASSSHRTLHPSMSTPCHKPLKWDKIHAECFKTKAPKYRHHSSISFTFVSKSKQPSFQFAFSRHTYPV